jgi:Leucine-rich repeat (LRR) protein
VQILSIESVSEHFVKLEILDLRKNQIARIEPVWKLSQLHSLS